MMRRLLMGLLGLFVGLSGGDSPTALLRVVSRVMSSRPSSVPPLVVSLFFRGMALVHASGRSAVGAPRRRPFSIAKPRWDWSVKH